MNIMTSGDLETIPVVDQVEEDNASNDQPINEDRKVQQCLEHYIANGGTSSDVLNILANTLKDNQPNNDSYQHRWEKLRETVNNLNRYTEGTPSDMGYSKVLELMDIIENF